MRDIEGIEEVVAKSETALYSFSGVALLSD